MTKLTKTQQALLDRANARDGRISSVEACGGKGAKGGRLSWGARERDALNKLAELGLVEIIRIDRSAEWMGNGNTLHCSLYTYQARG